MQRKIPTTIITGFLGSGKTTLIREMMTNANGRKIALIINEFGDVGVDGQLLAGCEIENCSDDDIVELANGCICCTVADDFIPAMTQILNRDVRPDHIVIETSGLALPQPLVRAFHWPEIKTQVTIDGVVTVVDADAVAAGRFSPDEAKLQAQREADDALDHETPLEELFHDQISCADLLVLSKCDLVNDEQLLGVKDILSKSAREGIQTIASEFGKLPLDVLLGQDARAEDDTRLSHHERHHHKHDHEHAHGDRHHEEGHDHNHHEVHHHHDHGHDAFESFSIEGGEIFDGAEFSAYLVDLIKTHHLLRLKGYGFMKDKPMRLQVQAVGTRLETYYDRPWQEGELSATRLVLIGHAGLDQAGIQKDFDQWQNQQTAHQADAAQAS